MRSALSAGLIAVGLFVSSVAVAAPSEKDVRTYTNGATVLSLAKLCDNRNLISDYDFIRSVTIDEIKEDLIGRYSAETMKSIYSYTFPNISAAVARGQMDLLSACAEINAIIEESAEQESIEEMEF